MAKRTFLLHNDTFSSVICRSSFAQPGPRSLSRPPLTDFLRPLPDAVAGSYSSVSIFRCYFLPVSRGLAYLGLYPSGGLGPP